MRLEVRVYAGAVVLLALSLTTFDILALPTWPYGLNPLIALVLLSLYIVTVQFQFQIHSGWATDASGIPAIATALLLPPGIGMLIACVGLRINALRRSRLGTKGLLHVATSMLAVGAAAHVSTLLGGSDDLINAAGWMGLPAALAG
jgi:hypothetical protein